MFKLDMGPRPVVMPPTDGYEHVTLHPLAPCIGAEVRGMRICGAVEDSILAEIRRALLDWKVLFFRDQEIDRLDQRAFAQRWGELEQHPFFEYIQPGQTAADVVTLAKDAVIPGVENEWHSDITWHAKPSFGALLRAVERPATGGDTMWADMAAAYDGLPDEIKERIEPLVAVHDWRHNFGLSMPSEDIEKLSPLFPPVEHPVVRIHPETGRRTLFVNIIFTTHILGLDPEESHALLERLFRQARVPEYQCRFRWRPNEVAFWDNRATQHYALSDYYPARRVMDRISIVGDRPVGAHQRDT